VPAGSSAAALQATILHPAEGMKTVSYVSPMNLIDKTFYGVPAWLWPGLGSTWCNFDTVQSLQILMQ
jgi:hypothetical protein